MTTGQGPAAELAPDLEVVGRHRGDDRAALLVLELADVHVSAAVADSPAEEDVAGGLKAALADDDAGAVIGWALGSQEPLEDGRLGLLDLEEQRVVVVRRPATGPRTRPSRRCRHRRP